MKKNKLDLLKDQRVIDEIARYKWIESEKAGYDISEERATKEWLSLYATSWEKAFLLTKSPRSTDASTPKKSRQSITETKIKRRGFALIKILIVISMISIAVSRIKGMRDKDAIPNRSFQTASGNNIMFLR